jgi:hypothetical protein
MNTLLHELIGRASRCVSRVVISQPFQGKPDGPVSLGHTYVSLLYHCSLARAHSIYPVFQSV